MSDDLSDNSKKSNPSKGPLVIGILLGIISPYAVAFFLGGFRSRASSFWVTLEVGMFLLSLGLCRKPFFKGFMIGFLIAIGVVLLAVGLCFALVFSGGFRIGG
jgi:hypothetical protein